MAFKEKRDKLRDITRRAGPIDDKLFDAFDAIVADALDTKAAADYDLERYRRDPIAWVVERLGVKENTVLWSENPGYEEHQWDGTVNPLAKVLTSLSEQKNVAVESGTGTGKTFIGGAAVLWFLDVYPGCTVVTGAPKEAQLTLHIWKEIGKFWPLFQKLHPKAELGKLRILMDPPFVEWAATGFSCQVGAGEESATKAQGFHAKDMLIITEETPGMDPAVMTAFENTCGADNNLRLAFGNPDSQTDQLHKLTQDPAFVAIRISALDHPNVVCGDTNIVPGATSQRSVDNRANKYGKDSRLYLSRVRGICPQESSDALIRWQWLYDATRMPPERVLAIQQTGPTALGVDVANSQNGDRASICAGVGGRIIEVPSWQCPDANRFATDRVIPYINMMHVHQKRVGVDVVGVGVGTFNEAKRVGYQLQPLNGGTKMIPQRNTEELFNNLRSQMWWAFRVDLLAGEIHPPPDEELFQDLCEPRWTTQAGKIVVESKEEIKERLGRSPDKGDAAVYWNWVRKTRYTGAAGYSATVAF